MIPVAMIQLTAMWFLIKENRITIEQNDNLAKGIICEATFKFLLIDDKN